MMVKRTGGLTRPPSLRHSRNKLLAALPARDYQRIFPLLNTVPLEFQQVLHKPGAKIDTVYFPESGVCSVIHTMKDGRVVEVANIGNEGFVGVTVLLGGKVSFAETLVQVPGDRAQFMSAVDFHCELDRRGPFYDLMSRYSQAQQALIMQLTACNSLHSAEERCSRWLLMTQDRVDSNELNVTHESLSHMLGVQRPTVTLALGVLEKAGVIQNGTRKITVVSRRKLNATSCECYQGVQNTFARLLPTHRKQGLR
jgi:CRP-like cAMP-binding protein